MSEKVFEPPTLEAMYQFSRSQGAANGVFITREMFQRAPFTVSLTINGVRKMLELGIELAGANAQIDLGLQVPKQAQ